MFAIAPGVTITEFDAALSGRYLLRTPKGSFMLSRSSVELIRSLEGKASLEHIARSPAEEQALEKFLDEHVIPTGVFGRPDDRPRAKQPGRPQVAYVYAVRELVSAQTLRHGTEVFKHLFRPCPALLILTLSVLAQASFWWLNRGLRLEHISVEEYAVGAFLFLLTLPFHELGHGSACRHFRCEHGAMGFAMYLVFPCFFTDVSEAWRLRRWARVVIDLGGIYFQILSAGLLSLLALWTSHQAWAAAVVMINWSIVHSLKPYLRGDGYWVLMDVVGIPAPYQRAKEYLRYLIARIRGRRADTPLMVQISRRLRWFTLGYVLVTTALAAWVVAAVTWKTVAVVLPAYPSVLMRFVALPLASPSWWRNALLAGGQTVLIAGLGIALWSWCGAGLRSMRRAA